MDTSDIPQFAALLICAVSVAVYAYRRMATPRSNRSSTRVRLYQNAQIGYISCIMILYLILSFALQYAAMDQLIIALGLSAVPNIEIISKLPAPLIATVLLTVWLPNAFLIRDIDSALLSAFQARANIPQAVRNRAARLLPETFSVKEEDLPGIQNLIVAEDLPEPLSRHLVAVPGTGLQITRYRLTRLLKLFGAVRKLSLAPRCARTFDDYSAEWNSAQNNLKVFCKDAVGRLEEAGRLNEILTPEAYEARMAGPRETFRTSAREIFLQLSVLLSAAVFAMEETEHEIGEKLRDIGFDVDDEPEIVEFPLRSLTGFVLLLLGYVIVTDLLLRRMHLLPEHDDIRFPLSGSGRPLQIVLCYAIAIGVTVWVIQRTSLARTETIAPLRWHIYVFCFMLAFVAHSVMWLGLFLAHYGEFPQTDLEWQVLVVVGLLVGALCGAVALFCDIDERRWPKALPRRLTEGLGCTLFLVVVRVIAFNLFPPPPSVDQGGIGPFLAIMLFFSSIAFLVGYFVPHLCRAERQFQYSSAA